MPLYTFDELISNPPSAQPSLIGTRLLPECGSLLLVAETGLGKSAIALDMAVCLVMGKPLWNAYRQRHGEKGKPFFPIHRSCRVLYLDTELGPVGCYDRCVLLRDRHTAGIGLNDALQIVSGEYKPILLHNRAGDKENYLANLEKAIVDARPDVVFFDPLAQFHERDENTSEMNGVLRQLKFLQHKYKFASIVLHHESDKENYYMGRIVPKADSTARVRGHSSIAAWADTVMRVSKDDKLGTDECGVVAISWTKVRHARKPRMSYALLDIGRMDIQWICADNAPNCIQRKADALRDYKALHYSKEAMDTNGDI